MRDKAELSRTVIDADGQPGFTDEYLSYPENETPLAITDTWPAAVIHFSLLPENFTGLCDFGFEDSLVLVQAGCLEAELTSGKKRRFQPGEVFQISSGVSNKILFRNPDEIPLRLATIGLAETPDITEPWRLPTAQDPSGAAFLRTVDGKDGLSQSRAGTLPYFDVGTGERRTAGVALSGVQFVHAGPTLDYSWHRAPQRQIVLFLTGGAEIENGHGEKHRVLPGDIYFGEDVSGQGHITRALDGRERFSVFAHLR